MDAKTIPFQRLHAEGSSDSAHKYPDPDLGWELIPAKRYTGKAFMDREWERLWTKVWLFGGREEVIAHPGDWMTTEMGRESFIFMRQDDGGVRGFYNVCPHRGNRIVAPDSTGSSMSLRCAYHHWEWDIDGTQKRIPDIETFPQLPGCVLNLKQVHVDTWGGCFWFRMSDEGPSLREWLGEIPAHLDRYGFERQKLIDWKTIEWDCNWKTSVDAFNETYHVQGIHPELLSWLDDYNVQIDCIGPHNRFLVPFTSPSPHHEEQEKLSDVMRAMAVGAGLDPDAYEGNPRGLRHAIQVAKRRMDTDVYPYAALSDDQLSDDYHYMIFPNVTMNIYAESLLLFVSRPHATDPDKMLFDVMIFGHLPPETPYMLPEHQVFQHGQVSLGQVLDQDAHNLPSVQAGMHSRSFEGLVLGKQELRIRHFHHTLMGFVGEDADRL